MPAVSSARECQPAAQFGQPCAAGNDRQCSTSPQGKARLRCVSGCRKPERRRRCPHGSRAQECRQSPSGRTAHTPLGGFPRASCEPPSPSGLQPVDSVITIVLCRRAFCKLGSTLLTSAGSWQDELLAAAPPGAVALLHECPSRWADRLCQRRQRRPVMAGRANLGWTIPAGQATGRRVCTPAWPNRRRPPPPSGGRRPAPQSHAPPNRRASCRRHAATSHAGPEWRETPGCRR